MITTDTNQDGKLDDLDATIGYISDFAGKKFTSNNPTKYSVIRLVCFYQKKERF